MSEPYTLAFRYLKWRCTLEFSDDQVKYSWDEWGLAVQKGSRIFVREQLSPHLSESSSMGARAKGPLLTAGGYLVLAMFSYVLLPVPWRYVVWLFLALFALAAYTGVSRFFRRAQWITIVRKDGASAVTIDVTHWPPEERTDFARYFGDWMGHSSGSSAPSVPPRKL